jgi:hypothetical protein
MEEFLNAMGYSESDEERILTVLGRGLLKEFPNPTRAGCPSPEVLRTIASHEMPLSDAERWLDHMTSCSACYKEFCEFQVARRSQRTHACWIRDVAQHLCTSLNVVLGDLHIRNVNWWGGSALGNHLHHAHRTAGISGQRKP